MVVAAAEHEQEPKSAAGRGGGLQVYTGPLRWIRDSDDSFGAWWMGRPHLHGNGRLPRIMCPVAGTCVVPGRADNRETFSGRSWRATLPPPLAVPVTCAVRCRSVEGDVQSGRNTLGMWSAGRLSTLVQLQLLVRHHLPLFIRTPLPLDIVSLSAYTTPDDA